MNTYITLSCLLAVVATGHGYALGYGGLGGYGYGLSSMPIIKAPILAPAISTQNLYKAAPIPIMMKHVAIAPMVSAPILKTMPVSTVSWGLNGGLGYGLSSYGLGLDGHGLGSGLYGKGMWIK